MSSTKETDNMMRPPRFDPVAEIRLVPVWAWGLAVLVYLGVQLIFHGLAWPHEKNPPGFAFQLLFPLFIGLLPAFFALLVGYVNVDAGRRGMSRALWTAVVILVPNALGFIVYFLVRQPILTVCPRCGHRATDRANYCPNCAFNFRPTCPRCKAALGTGDRFCANCGYRMLEDGAKAQG